MDKEFLQKELERASNWVQFADKKSAFLAVYYSVFIGYMISVKEILVSHLTNSVCLSFFDVLVITVLFSVAFGVYHIFFSVFPNLTNNNSNSSLFYFGHIATLTSDQYQNQITTTTEDEIKAQIAEQIHTNSQIASKKMHHVKKASQALFVSAGLLLVLILFM